MKISKGPRVCLSILNLIFSTLAALVPLITAYLVDKAIDKTMSDVYKYTAILAGLILAEIIISLARGLIVYKASLRLEKRLKESLYKEALGKEISELNSYHAAELEQLFNTDIANIINKEISIIPEMVKDITRVLVCILVVIYVDWIFMIGLLVCGLLGFAAAKLYSHIIRPMHKRVLEAEGKESGYIVESFTNARLIKSYKAEEYSKSFFDSINTKYIREKKKRNALSFMANTFIFTFTNIMYVMALFYGAYFIAKDKLSYGSLVALIQLLGAIEVPVLSFSSLVSSLSLCMASKGRVDDLYNKSSENEDDTLDDFDEIVFENVSFSYDKEVIKDLSFTIKKALKP